MALRDASSTGSEHSAGPSRPSGQGRQRGGSFDEQRRGAARDTGGRVVAFPLHRLARAPVLLDSDDAA